MSTKSNGCRKGGTHVGNTLNELALGINIGTKIADGGEKVLIQFIAHLFHCCWHTVFKKIAQIIHAQEELTKGQFHERFPKTDQISCAQKHGANSYLFNCPKEQKLTTELATQ
jgi:hypothetical protein